MDFVAADMPSANRLTVEIMAMVADEERRMISARTKAALAAAKARGVKLGGDRGSLPQVQRQGSALGVKARIAKANDRASLVAEAIADLKASGASSLRQIAAGLNERGIKTPRGGEWSAVQVSRILERVA